ncbi:hypothetical protein [Amycolatopsis anabasis]|uniref:hypothetical protein n=1 Tax=Amycolatopsis anabasis TaxID=1840409 RepID=UPI00131B1EE2|nr:hypothetical protein [Amycolatopsis anabasis]
MNKTTHKLVIDEHEALIVRLIFDLSAEARVGFRANDRNMIYRYCACRYPAPLRCRQVRSRTRRPAPRSRHDLIAGQLIEHSFAAGFVEGGTPPQSGLGPFGSSRCRQVHLPVSNEHDRGKPAGAPALAGSPPLRPFRGHRGQRVGQHRAETSQCQRRSQHPGS